MISLFDMLLNDPISWTVSLLIAAITFYLAKFYYRVMSLPPGPLPLPLLGNMLSLRGTKNHNSIEFIKYYRKYGPIFTFWTEPRPMVFICDIELGRDAFRRNEFAGRPPFIFASYFSNEKHTNVAFADYGPQWESLRRVAHSAVRSYATSDGLAYLICDVTDDTVKTIIEKEGINKPFVPFTLIYFTFFSIMASSAFGKRYAMDDPEFLKMKYVMSDLIREENNTLAMVEFLPILRPFYKKSFKKFDDGFQQITQLFIDKFKDHHKDYNDEIIRDFCDSLIRAKNEALKENKESAPYLSDANLAMTVTDLFVAGTDTSQHTFKWIVLFMANFPEMQNKMRNEIESVIGDRMPVHDDRNNCHYVYAFISEAMRFRSVVPFGLFHKNLVSAKIGDQKIPAETTIFIHQYLILNDPKYWTNPEVFNPNRFLENDKFITHKPPAFIPFGTGRRVCLGEKLGITDLFLVLVRFLQSTNGHTISLVYGPGTADLEPDPMVFDSVTPKKYKIILQKS